MNTHAQRLGMTHSHFTNATGLPDPELYTTARDMTLVTAATIREFPEYYAWYSEKEFVYHGIKQNNHNRLLWQDAAVDGVKTGHTEAAGYCLVASAKRDSMRLTSVVMGAKSEKARAQASLALLDCWLPFLRVPQALSGGAAHREAAGLDGGHEGIAGGACGGYPCHHSAWPLRQARGPDQNPDIIAPVAKGDKWARSSLTVDGEGDRSGTPHRP